MRRILFVDDDPAVLDGLRDLLRKQRKQWQMVFALGGPAAMDELEKAEFDVIVSDMRMPVIDGAMLLHHVKERYPGAARIILSGQADRQSVVRALPAAHQFLSKPCDAETLRTVVERAYQLQRTLHGEGVRSVISHLDQLPPTPHTYWELTKAAAEPESGVADFAAIVEQDPAMPAKVLALLSSASFGLTQRITSVQEAASGLGVELLKALVLSAHAFSSLPLGRLEEFSIDQLQRHSLLCGRLSRRLLGSKDAKRATEVFTAAVVHDIGKLILAAAIPERYASVLQTYAGTSRTLHSIEHELLGVTHAEVGGYLLGSWGLPLPIVEAVSFHHTPDIVKDGEVTLLAALHCADGLLDAELSRKTASTRDDKLDRTFIARVGMTDKVEAARALAVAML